ncbi:MAG TPA: G1 family glutamic endopeptidase [Acidimicrobiales bacterium]
MSCALGAATLCIATVSLGGSATPVPNAALLGPLPHGGQDLVAPTRPGIDRRNTGVGSSSYNWSGYAQSAPRNTFTAVATDIVVTTVNTSVPGTQYSSDWVGIGGFSDPKLVQAGIEEDNLNGRAFYQAWTEILPRSEDPLSLAISAGDKIVVTVKETANKHGKNKRWLMIVADVTTGHSAGRTVRYNSTGASVEAIHERPCIGSPCSTHLATLATTTNESFDPSYYSTSPPSLSTTYRPLLTPASRATLYDLVMVGSNGSTVATPSNADSLNDGFKVGDGSTVPAPPSS